jgi:signal transduction histidine kinase
MKIKTKLTIRFTLMVAVILLVLLSVIYTLAYKYKQEKFYDRVRERALISAHIFLEKDEVSKVIFESFQKKYVQKLHDEIIQFYDEEDEHQFISEDKLSFYSGEITEQIRQDNEIRFKKGNRVYYGIFYEDNQGDFVIIASAIDKFGDYNLEKLRYILIASFIFGLIFTYIGGNIYAQKALQPISEIIQQVDTIKASKLDLRVNEGNGKDELAELAITFNDMLDRLELAFKSQKTFVSNASHEMRTPLTAILGEIEVLLSKERNSEEYKKTLKSVQKEVLELSELINNLLNLAQTDIENKGLDLQSIRIDELLFDIKDMLIQQDTSKELNLEIMELPENDEELTLLGNKSLLTSAILNIIENGFKFSNNQPVTCQLNLTPHGISIVIIDQGIGISHKDKDQIFEPFFRSEQARQFSGHGVGLPLSEKIIRMHGGHISIESELNKGTAVTINFDSK